MAVNSSSNKFFASCHLPQFFGTYLWPIRCQATNLTITMPNPSTNRSRGSPHSTQGSRHQESTLNLTRLGGMIMWLPPLNDTLPTHSRLRDQYYHHPVVILSPQASSPTADVVVLIVGAFAKRGNAMKDAANHLILHTLGDILR